MSTKTLLSHGVTTCGGCAMELLARTMVDILGERTIIATPPSCSAILTGFEHATGWAIPAQQTVLMSVGAYISGIAEAMKIRGETNFNVVGFAGDGGTFDIGLQALSGAIERQHDFLMVCYNNEAYMNTGNQRSSATPLGAFTKTTPAGKAEVSKNIDFMFLHQPLRYQATASVGDINDLRRKIKRASQVRGPKLLHVHVPCTAGWKFPSGKTIKVARSAIDCGIVQLWERENAEVKINKKPKDFALTKDYLEMQGRFHHIREDDIKAIEQESRRRFEFISAIAAQGLL